METWHLAVCKDCRPGLPQPFHDRGERDRWAEEHAAAHSHVVVHVTERRAVPDPGPVPRLEGDNIVMNWHHKGPAR